MSAGMMGIRLRVTLALFIAVVHTRGERHIAAGIGHTCVIKSGSWDVFCTGNGTFGATSPPAGPFHALTAGDTFTCGLWTNGTAVCWGAVPEVNNNPAELFIPSFDGEPLEFIDISGRVNHFCGLMYNGSVKCFGDTSAGACAAPQQSVFQSITAGSNYTCGIRRDNSIECWGAQDNSVLQAVPPGQRFSHVACGTAHACGLLLDNTISCWGQNSSGELSQVSGNYSWVSAGHSFTCAIALGSDSTVCWGSINLRHRMVVLEISCATNFCAVIRSVHGTLRAAGWTTVITNSAQDLAHVYDMIDALVATTGTLFSTFVGSGTMTFADGPGSSASFNNPARIAMDSTGIIYIADSANNRIRQVMPDLTVSTFAGSGNPTFADGQGSTASFNSPWGLTLDTAGNVYVADALNHRIRKITADGMVSTLAGNGTAVKMDGSGTVTAFSKPNAVFYAPDGFLYVADTGNNCIRKVSLGGAVTTVAGNGTVGSANGRGTSATFNFPYDVAMDASGTIFVADAYNNLIRKITPDGIVSTLAGTGLQSPHTDGPAMSAIFSHPYGIAIDGNGYKYVTDFTGYRVRKISPTGGVSTLGGNGLFTLAEGVGTDAAFRAPAGVQVDPNGDIYVADTNNHRIRIGIPQTAVTVSVGNVPRTIAYSASDAVTTWRMTSLSNSLTDYKPYFVSLPGCNIPSAVNANHTRGLNSGIETLDMQTSCACKLHTGGIFPLSMSHGPKTLLLDSRDIPDGALALSSLQSIFIKGPVQLHDDSFQRLPALTRINCASTGTATLSGLGAYSGAPGTLRLDVVRHLTNMQQIELHNNNISTFETATGGWSLPAVQTLRVCGGNNGTATLFSTMGAFSAFPNVLTLSSRPDSSDLILDMRECGIGSLHPSAFPALNDSITGVNLSENSIVNVSLLTAALLPIFRMNKRSYLDLSDNSMTTVQPHDFDGFVGLQSLVLRRNAIFWVAESAFTSLKHPHLVSVDVSGNPIEYEPCPAGYFNDIRVLLAGARVVACFECMPGFYCPGDSNSIPCPAGYSNDEAKQTNISACLACPIGTSNALTGQTRLGCALCAAGTASSTIAAASKLSCMDCPAGSYSPSPGNAECTSCPAGTFSNRTGAYSASTCQPCPLNTYSASASAITMSACLPCPEGSVTLAAGTSSAASCVAVACASGHVRDSNGECQACTPGTYAFQGSCTLCPPGRFSSVNAAVVCTACPIGTYRSIAGGNSSSSCSPCRLGSVCRSDGVGCNAICPAGYLLQSQSPTLQQVTSQCGIPTRQQLDSLCTVCLSDSLSLEGVCAAGLPTRLPLMSAMLAGNAAAEDALTPGKLVLPSLQQGFDSCGKYVLSELYTEPANYFAAVRTPLLIATFSAAGFLILSLSPWVRTSKPSRVASILQGIDHFASDHPVAVHDVLRNSPSPSGGMFTTAFMVAALGMSLSILVQLATHTYIASLSVINTPPVDFVSSMQGVHYGQLTADILLIGQYSDLTCAGVVMDAGGGWALVSTQGVALEAAAVYFSLPTSMQQTGLLGCHVTATCTDCRMTTTTSVNMQYDLGYQSVVVQLRTRAAYKTCSPVFVHAYSAPSADTLLSAITMDIQVLPVAFTYSGTMGAGQLHDNTGHDVVLSSSTVAFMPDATLLRPDTDVVSLTLAFTPTPYSALIVVNDAMDGLTVITSILGLVSGLSGGFRVLVRRWDKATGATKNKLLSSQTDAAPQSHKGSDDFPVDYSDKAVMQYDEVAGGHAGISYANPLQGSQTIEGGSKLALSRTHAPSDEAAASAFVVAPPRRSTVYVHGSAV